MEDGQIIIHTDGGSRSNPGPAASAFVVEKDGKTIYEGSKFLGKATNNVAEYTGVIIALQWLLENSTRYPVSSIQFILDSELVVKQLKGLYKVKDENLRNLFFEIFSLIKKINSKVTFQHTLRAGNKRADFLVNEELDRN